jgi:predicted nuclease of predicted toxin-antitoxin system
MAKYLIDANLPYRFSFWNSDQYLHQSELGDTWPDHEIWEYARQRSLTIITKDSDFSDKMMMSDPPPKVIHIKIGNMKLSEMHDFFAEHWQAVISLSESHRLVNVFNDQITAIE